jgi:hypothetical protein
MVCKKKKPHPLVRGRDFGVTILVIKLGSVTF